MSIPKEPRQQMINMMYLVLTALLALNVSAEILEAFSVVNKSLNDTYQTTTTRNLDVYSAFQREMDKRPHEARKWFERANKVKLYTDNLEKFLEEHKKEIIARSGGMLEGTLNIKKAGDLNVPSTYMITQGHGAEIRQAIISYRDSFLSVLEEEDRLLYEKTLPLGADLTDYPAEQTEEWVRKLFDNMPSVAAVTHVSKILNDVKNTESQVLTQLYQEIGGQIMEVDTFLALVNSTSSYVMQGETYESEIVLAAASKNLPMEISIGGQTIPIINGKGVYKVTAGSPGEKSYTGNVRVYNAKADKWEEFAFKSDYFVANSMASIAATKMNVMYVNIENPLSVAVAGVDENLVRVSTTGTSTAAVQRAGRGKYLLKPSRPGLMKVVASSTLPSGRVQSFVQEFRVKPVPEPTVHVKGKTGSIARGLITQSTGLSAKIPGFEFADKPIILSGDVLVFRAGQVEYRGALKRGGNYNSTVLGFLNKLKRGDMVFFDNIKVKNPDGRTYPKELFLKVK